MRPQRETKADTFQDEIRAKRRVAGEDVPDPDHDPRHSHTVMMRILGPLINFVNRPWKVRPLVIVLDNLMGIMYRCILSASCLGSVESAGTIRYRS